MVDTQIEPAACAGRILVAIGALRVKTQNKYDLSPEYGCCQINYCTQYSF